MIARLALHSLASFVHSIRALKKEESEWRISLGVYVMNFHGNSNTLYCVFLLLFFVEQWQDYA